MRLQEKERICIFAIIKVTARPIGVNYFADLENVPFNCHFTVQVLWMLSHKNKNYIVQFDIYVEIKFVNKFNFDIKKRKERTNTPKCLSFL